MKTIAITGLLLFAVFAFALSPADFEDSPHRASVVVECIFFDPDVDRDYGAEVATLRVDRTMDTRGWRLIDAAEHAFALPGRTVSSGERIDVPNPGSAVWNNGGDTAFVVDAQGRLVDWFEYDGRGVRACRS